MSASLHGGNINGPKFKEEHLSDSPTGNTMVDIMDCADENEIYHGFIYFSRIKSSRTQLKHRRCTTSHTSTSSIPMSAKNVFACMVGLWAIHSFQRSSLFDARRLHRSPLMVEAFSDGLSSRRRHFSSSSLAAKHGAIHLEKTSTLSTRSVYSAFHPCKVNAVLGIPCRNGFQSGANDQLNTGTRSTCRSLLICQSTISDETVEVAVPVKDTTTKINGAVEAESMVKDTSSQIPIGINGDEINGQQPSNDASSDISTATANGGFTHTTTSRAKISAANKGKVPWNKGKARSEEVKARIAEGVRRKNRERFLAKLADEGVTEEEYTIKKKEERRKKDAERRARRTAKGGYTPTEETKQKISKILKEKYASGDVKRKPRDPSKVRRGFKHTEETKQKIRESLKRKWADDTDYRELMTNKTVASGNVSRTVRNRISETLKKRWEDPEFRAIMMEKFKDRKARSGPRDQTHRQRISEAMKRKWMDEEYRKRATEGMNKGRENLASQVKAARPLKPKMPQKPTYVQSMKPLSPLKTRTVLKTTTTSSSIQTKKKKKKAATKKKSSSGIEAVKPKTPTTSTPRKKKPTKKEKEQPPDGSISRMREERRDLYDLLYGDEEDGNGGKDNASMGKGMMNGESNLLGAGLMTGEKNTMAALLGDDDDLDEFDPYGLQA